MHINGWGWVAGRGLTKKFRVVWARVGSCGPCGSAQKKKKTKKAYWHLGNMPRWYRNGLRCFWMLGKRIWVRGNGCGGNFGQSQIGCATKKGGGLAGSAEKRFPALQL
jgi:hypothetical protein